jgi:hypothetical protein
MPKVIGGRVTKKYERPYAKPQKKRIITSQVVKNQVQEVSRQHTLEYVRSTLIHAVNELESRYGGDRAALELLLQVRFTLTTAVGYETYGADEQMGEYEDKYEDDDDDEEGGVTLYS